ncbi:deubiquitinase OTUD6B isoform X2 [Oncorhynchus kisutch]|uniref:deubiquitinase OTUD6B isoform X2 n=1 Tax=Oncorhynchus kisutch TaxID=8019 RepID=UPI0012DF3D93|nr:deubiquitinase OTUD6B isoform X2 [Oncorhynchus kisutch]
MEDVTIETAEEILAKQHRKEKKDLQAQIQSMKNAVPKNDKKRRKQLTEDIVKLEAELNQKHNEELQQLDSSGEKTVDEVVNGVESLALEGEEEQKDAKQGGGPSKAQKRRDKKAAAEKERERRIAEAEVENLSGLRHQEGLKLSQKLVERQLQIREISSDGHCMYRAVEDQLGQHGLGLTLKDLRAQTAQHMRSHTDDFLPFLTNTNTGDMYTPDEFDKYCSDVADTAAWGGQLELRALTQVLQRPIEVLQADSPAIMIGEEFDKSPITLMLVPFTCVMRTDWENTTTQWKV